MELYDDIYDSLIGELTEDTALSWVPNAFAPGSDCDRAHSRLLQARDRVLEKLGKDDDPNVEQMLDEMHIIQYALCHQILNLCGEVERAHRDMGKFLK